MWTWLSRCASKRLPEKKGSGQVDALYLAEPASGLCASTLCDQVSLDFFKSDKHFRVHQKDGQRDVRCMMLRLDPAQRDRLADIIANLRDRIREATERRWLGEGQGPQISPPPPQSKTRQPGALHSAEGFPARNARRRYRRGWAKAPQRRDRKPSAIARRCRRRYGSHSPARGCPDLSIEPTSSLR